MGQSPASGQVFAGYRIERLLGAGGMGEVFLATDRDLPRFVALKLLGRDRTGDPEVVARFRREAAAAALSGTGAPATTMRSPAPRRRGRGGGRRRRRTLALVTALTVVFAICGTGAMVVDTVRTPVVERLHKARELAGGFVYRMKGAVHDLVFLPSAQHIQNTSGATVAPFVPAVPPPGSPGGP
ncbi:hypothetical protein [Nocardia sp. X0981]